MKIFYDTKTNSVKNFLKDCNLLNVSEKINKETITNEPFVFVCNTTTRFLDDGVKYNGMYSKLAEEFLQKNHKHLLAVASSGEKNWGIDNFAMSGEKISQMYGVPLLLKFEKRGNKKDRDIFIEKVGKLKWK